MNLGTGANSTAKQCPLSFAQEKATYSLIVFPNEEGEIEMKKAVAVSVGVLVSLGIATSYGVEDAKTKFTVEVETFKLTGAKVVTLKGEDGGKGVVLADKKSRAEIKVKLTKGRWMASLYMIAGETDEPDGIYEQDAVYLEFAGQLSRLYDSSLGKSEANVADVDPNDPSIDLYQPEVEIEKDGEYTIVLKYAEPNVTLDRIVFTKQ